MRHLSSVCEGWKKNENFKQMKELEKHEPGRTEIVAQKQVEKRLDLATLKPKPGHRIWELDIKEGLIREVQLKDTGDLDLKRGAMGARVRKLVTRDGCLYCSALNADNADKKFMKMIALEKLINK